MIPEYEKRIALLTIPFFLVIIAALAILNNTTVFEPPLLLPLMNTVFLGLIPLFIAWIAFRTYRSGGSLSVLLLGSGMLVFGLGSIAAGWLNGFPGGANITTTIHNISFCIGSVLSLTAVLLILTGQGPERDRAAPIPLFVYGALAASVALLSIATVQGHVPPFFIQGTGPTALRQVILSNATEIYALTAVLFFILYIRKRDDFFFWFSLALALIAIGLLAVFIQPAVGSLLGWAGRCAQYSGAVCSLVAMMVARREATRVGIPLTDQINRFIGNGEATQAILSASRESIWLFSPDGIILMANPIAVERLGKGQAYDIVGHHFSEFLAPGTAALRGARMEEVVRTRQQVRFEDERDGIIFDHTLYPAFGGGGEVTGIAAFSRDITGKKQAEDALLAAYERTAAILEQIADTFYSLDDQWRFTLVNPAAEKAPFGRSKSELLGKVIWDLYPGLVGTPIHRHYLDAAEKHTLEHFEAKSPLNSRWYEVYLQGREGGVDVYMRDITDRHRADQALRENEEKYRGLFENVQESVAIYQLVYDENGEAVDRVFVDVNPKAIEEMGYGKREDIIGKPYSEVVLRHFPGDQKSIDMHLQSLAEVARSGKPLTYDTHFGNRSYITTQYPIGRDLVASSSIEITSRKQAEEGLRESEMQLRRAQELLDSITKSSGVMIAAEDTEFRYTYFNKAYADEIQKLTGKELTPGMSMVDLFADMPGEQENSVKQWKKVLEGKSIKQTISFENPGREPKTFNVIHTPIRDNEGTVIGAGEVSYDVTRQIQTADELRKTGQYLENLINYANAPIIVWDKEFRITRFNHAFERLTGRIAEDVLGQRPDILMPEKYRRKAMDLIRKATTGDRWEVVEIPILHSGGDIRTVLWNSATLYEDDGKTIIATIAQGQDITESNLALEALKQSEFRERAQLEELAKVLDAVPAAVWISHDPQALHISGNRLSHEWLNLADGANMSKSAPPGDRPETFRMFRDGRELRPEEMPVQLSSSGKNVRNFEFDFLYPGGVVRHVLGNATPLLDDSGNPRGSVSAFIDITDRMRAEETVLSEKKKTEETLSLLNATLESTADGIFVVNTARKITNFNQNFISLWNIHNTALLTGDDREVLEYMKHQVTDPQAFLERVLDLYRYPERERFDMVELNDGRIFERHSTAQKLQDEIIGRVWSYRDVTDRRRAEEKLLQSLKEKETLIREIHHRVKNNLQIISGLLDMTRMRTPDSTTTGILTDMMMKIKTMAQIHTRLYESKQFDKINMGIQVRDQVTDMLIIYGRSGTEILSEINVQDVYLTVDQAIPCALVVNEILSNAFKHAFKGRKQGNILVTVTREPDLIRIIVRDDGIGIPGDVDVYKTTSLGLKLIRSLVLQMNGTVNIESNQGTEVTVECPFHSGGG